MPVCHHYNRRPDTVECIGLNQLAKKKTQEIFFLGGLRSFVGGLGIRYLWRPARLDVCCQKIYPTRSRFSVTMAADFDNPPDGRFEEDKPVEIASVRLEFC